MTWIWVKHPAIKNFDNSKANQLIGIFAEFVGRTVSWLGKGLMPGYVRDVGSVWYRSDLDIRPSKSEMPAYNAIPANCFKCGWKKKRLSKKEQTKITEQAIKSGVSYQKAQKTYLAQYSFCSRAIVGKQKDKGVKNRNQVRFWTDKVGEERLICNKCLRENGEFQKLLLEKYRGRWQRYKNRGQI